MQVVPKAFAKRLVLALGALSLATPIVQGVGSSGAQTAEPVVVQYTTVGATSFTVPDDVQCVWYDLIGAAGGRGNGATPGLGGRVAGVIQVLPGQSLQVNVGGKGGDATGTGGSGGSNGGGVGGSTPLENGGGGGGASDLRQGGTTLDDRAAVAGGGGGTGSFGTVPPNGGNGGEPGQPGQSGDGGEGGGGGNGSAGGAGGASLTDSPEADGQPGTFGQGGAGGGGTGGTPQAPIDAGAGGGGGGWYGGGGGGGASSGLPGAGGGGSNHIANGVGSNLTGIDADNDGNGRASIRYTPGDDSCVVAPLTITKMVSGFVLPPGSLLIDGMRFTVRVQCDAPSIDLGSLGLAGASDHVGIEFISSGNGAATPVGLDTISFVSRTQCTLTEPFAQESEGVDTASFTCDVVPPIAASSSGVPSSLDAGTTAVQSGDPVCPVRGPVDGSIVVNVVEADQTATVTVINVFAPRIAPRFTG